MYLGILDDGKVNGFSLTQYQVNNITENLSLKQLHSCLQMCFSLTQFQVNNITEHLSLKQLHSCLQMCHVNLNKNIEVYHLSLCDFGLVP